MKKWNKEALLRTSVLASFVAASAAAAPALAQEDEEGAQQRDRIVVTGSRIARSDFSSESPVSVITGADIQQAGNLDLGQVLREQVAVDSGGFSASSNLSGGGASTISLRGLGAARTLTLLNGRRVANFADGLQNRANDLGFIPSAMVERVEILRDGASAVYGADAVSGVVNIILRNDFEGFRVSGQYGQSGQSDYDQYQIEMVMGGNFNRGNIVVSAGYSYTDMVPQRNRDWAANAVSGLFNFPSGNQPFLVTGSGAHPGGQVSFADGSSWCTNPMALGGDGRTNVAGTLACPGTALANAAAYPTAPNAGNRYDYAFVQSILNGSERLNATLYGTYDVADDISAFLEVQYAQRRSNNVLDGNPVFAGSGTAAFPEGWVIAADNPHNPNPGVRAVMTMRPTDTIGPRNQEVIANNIRLVTGLQGLTFGFDWEASYMYARTDSTLTTDSTFNLARANRISDPAACALDPLCVAVTASTGGALDAYRPGNWTEEQIQYMRQIATSTFAEDINAVNFFFGRDIFTLPAGEVGFAAGYEYRRETFAFRPDQVTASGESVANQTFPTNASYYTHEVFAEVNVPLIRDQLLVQELSLNAQARYFDYSTFGSDSVYKLGLNWVMTDDVRIRGTYGTSFRIPTLVNSFSGGTVSFDFLNDPCDAGQINANPTRQANCLAGGPLGVTPGFTQAAPQIPVLAGGSAAFGVDLEPEQGTTWTIGAVFTPSQVPGLRFSIDYYSIEVDNFIDSLALQSEVLNACYDSVGLSDPACTAFTRDPSSQQLQGLARFPLNRDVTLESRGFDWAAEYTFDLANLFRADSDMGSLRLTHEGTYKTELNIGSAPGNYGAGGASPEYLLLFGADWNYREFGLGWRTRFIPSLNDPRYDGRNFLGYDDVDSNTIHDVRVRWEARPNTQILFGVNNVFDQDPPYAFDTGTNTITGLYGSSVIGRYFFGRITQEF
ncbi:TonB-dependent receptor [Glycocaulis alkaliphilus]|uniref:TonB-dependent receptor n=1 Tax=Glycocaulis alkaliphilus TaxID=1434191 RepID=A0A3T0E808_9PROT|nr:TonB-dependent receptor [Glycocaulis alkaliphilus]AZU03390.1 TonB-dependent receptor [Glycocaulis alkaliphilus]GGB86718.1 TonB-dependent receptor [Glycocaulis alkaliphilus]